MEEYIKAFKNKKSNIKDYKKIKTIISKFLLGVIFFLISIIFANSTNSNLLLYKEYVFTESLPFSKIKNWYESHFGEVLPEPKGIETVFNEKIIYKDIKDYYDGEELTIATNSMVNSLESGVVVFIGNKDNYGSTIIIQGVDGYDIWYGNITNSPYKLYDYIEKNSVIGETIDDKLYLLIKNDNEIIKYEDYQS